MSRNRRTRSTFADEGGCCKATGGPSEVTARDCPRCSQRGRVVADATLDALLRAPNQRGGGPWRFCRNADCSTVYFHGTGAVLEADALNVRVGQKEHGADRLVCYCFGHTAEDLLRRPSIQHEVKAACKRGEDRCPQTNPQGHCCLGNVADVLSTSSHVQGLPRSVSAE